MKTLKICRLIAAVLAEIFIVIAFVDMYRKTEAGALLLLMVFFMSSVPFIYSESRKMGSRSELIRHITPGTLYGKMLFYAAFALVAMVAAFIDPEDILLMSACFFLGVFNSLDSYILYRFRKSIS
ncbi:MAG: hypothetical protein J6C35_05670 [Bacteroidales bacterium]|nr:hypothetical protein [Bacteroidales bacterium]